RRLRPFWIVGAAVLISLAFLSTIKSVLYVPAFLGVALYRTERPVHRWALIGATVLFVLAGALLFWSAPLLPADGVGGLLRDVAELGRDSVDRMFSAGIFPQRHWLHAQIIRAPLL